MNHEYMAQPGRLRRPGRGLKTEDKLTEPIHPTASHTEILTAPDGVVVYRPEGAELAEFRARGAKAQEELVKSIGPSAVPIWARIQAAVKACGG